MPEPVSKRAQVARNRRTAMRALAGRVCSVLGWQNGRVQAANPRSVHFRRLGGVLAGLHDHASGWAPPPGFVRMRWDWETFFGDTMEYGGVSAAGCWDLLPVPVRAQFDEVAQRMRGVMAALGAQPDAFGLIHADLHLENALFDGDAVRLIDFDDCGFGYWLYDLAVPLWEYRGRDDYASIRAALVDGYSKRRALPDLTHLDDFIATREVAFGLWFAGMAQVNRRSPPTWTSGRGDRLGTSAHHGHQTHRPLGIPCPVGGEGQVIGRVSTLDRVFRPGLGDFFSSLVTVNR